MYRFDNSFWSALDVLVGKQEFTYVLGVLI